MSIENQISGDEPQPEQNQGKLETTPSIEPTAESEEISKIRERNKEIVVAAAKELDEIWKDAEKKAKESEDELAKIREKNELILAEAKIELDEIMKKAEKEASELSKAADEEKARKIIEAAEDMALNKLMLFQTEPYRKIKDKKIQQETCDRLRQIASERQAQLLNAMRKKADTDIATKEANFKKDMAAMEAKSAEASAKHDEKIREIIKGTNESIKRIGDIKKRFAAGEIDYKTAQKMLDDLKQN